MKKYKNLTCFALLLAIALLFSSCGGNTSDTSKQSPQETAGSNPQDVHSYSTFSLLFHEPYLDAAGIEVHCQSERKNLMKKIPEVLETEPNVVSGKSKVYIDGILKYNGEMKNGKYDGYGTAYFDDGSILYEGEWKKDVYHGKGTLYNADGTVSYTGKWKNGDYAS